MYGLYIQLKANNLVPYLRLNPISLFRVWTMSVHGYLVRLPVGVICLMILSIRPLKFRQTLKIAMFISV